MKYTINYRLVKFLTRLWLGDDNKYILLSWIIKSFFRYTGINKKYSPFCGSIWEVVAYIDWIERIKLHQSINNCIS